MADLRCIVVTPEETVCDEPAQFVALTLFDGEIGIATNHTPVIGRLGYGEMRIQQGDQTIRYFVEGGFVEVVDDVVSVLTNRAILAEKLDADIAEEQLQVALARDASTSELMEIRNRAIALAAPSYESLVVNSSVVFRGDAIVRGSAR